jgi:hypothetical protein
VNPVRLTYLNERPSAFTAACAHAHADRVGGLVVRPRVPMHRRPWTDQPASIDEKFTNYQSVQFVQLQGAQILTQGINGPTAKATGTAKSLIASVEASGVPPRGRPV